MSNQKHTNLRCEDSTLPTDNQSPLTLVTSGEGLSPHQVRLLEPWAQYGIGHDAWNHV